jgi:YceI-like domain
MKKILILNIFLIITTFSVSQKMFTRNGEIKFEGSMPAAIEEIAAINKTVSCVFDMQNGNFATLALVKSFKFKAPLMEEHFNENYIESSKFPKATFSGKILNFDVSKLTSSKNIYDLEGDLSMHGVTKKIKTKIQLSLNSGKITSVASFSIKPKDYEIDIPSIVKDKIAENVKLSINFILEPK